MKKFIRNGIITIFLLITLITSSYAKTGNPQSPVIYNAGYVNVGGHDRACFWTDNNSTPTFVASPDYYLSMATAIFVSDGYVYTAGFYLDITFKFKACYWKTDLNSGLTTLITLGTPTQDSIAYAIFVSQGDVYIAGEYTEKLMPTRACYWKNDNTVLTTLGVGWEKSNAYAIFVSKGDVYTAGCSANTTACYWTNNNATPAIIGGIKTIAYSLYVSKENVYTAGTDVNNGKRACYWINSIHNNNKINTSVYLGVEGQESGASAILVSGNDIYTAGYYVDSATKGRACYWKNDNTSPITLGPAGLNSSAGSLFVFNKDIYINGAYIDETGKCRACYWQNDSANLITIGAVGQDSVSNAIFIQ